MANGSGTPNNTRRDPVSSYESLKYYYFILGAKTLRLEQ
jgi:hypothetical protein